MRSNRGAVGQQVLAASAAAEGEGSPAVQIERRLERREHDRSIAHADLLADVLALARENELCGRGLATPAQLALLLDCSEHRAHDLLTQARLFAALPDGMDRLRSGWLTEEQVRAVTAELSPLAPADAALVFAELAVRLDAERAVGIGHPPARLRELVRRVLARLLPAELAEQRSRNAVDDDVSVQRNDDGTTNLLITGVSGPNTQSALHRIATDAQTAGSWDSRTDGQRRRDAAVDLLTGRTSLPLAQPAPCVVTDSGRVVADPQRHPADRPTRCGCPAGTQVPCGADVQVLVPLATALGLSTVPAQLLGTRASGAGVLDQQLLSELLHNAPALTAVFVDEHGTPVALGDTTRTPEQRHDTAALHAALLRVAAAPPAERFPVHPDDHDPAGVPPERPPPAHPHDHDHDHDTAVRTAGTSRRAAHPAGRTGPYSIRPRLRALVQTRSVRCEWPSCGARAVVCDLDHDLHWPDGPTCACNLGALCRHHHRVKQTGWTKTGRADGSVLWTSPTGRAYRTPSAHPAVPAPTRTVTVDPDLEIWLSLPQATRDDLDRLADHASPLWDEWERSLADPAWLSATPDHDPEADSDRTGDLIRGGHGLWELDRHDPCAWLPPEAVAS